MTTDRAPVLKIPGEGRTVGVVGDTYRFLATGEETGGMYALWEAVVPPGGGPPPHRHSREDEGFHVLEGEIVFYCDEKRTAAGPGTFVNMPVGSRHWFTNESQTPARMLILVAPAGLEKMFFEVGRPVDPQTASAPRPTKDDLERLLSIAPKYGLEIEPPRA